jgi:flagellar motor switch protein FliG
VSEPTTDNSNPVAASSRVISQAEKAAIVVSAMLRSGLDIPVDDLSVDAQAQLAKELANLQFVERNLLTEVIEEFSSEVTSIGLNLRGGAAQTLNLLEGKISTETAERLRIGFGR